MYHFKIVFIPVSMGIFWSIMLSSLQIKRCLPQVALLVMTDSKGDAQPQDIETELEGIQ